MLKKKYRKDIYMELSTKNGEVNFFEYQFTKKQFKEELEKVGFKITAMNGVGIECGLCHNLGSIIGKADNSGKILFNHFGKMLLSVLTPNISGHMICAIVRKL